MGELIITNHEVVRKFIMMILRPDGDIPVKSHVTQEDVEGAVVYSDRQIPLSLLMKTKDFFALRTEDWIDLSKCSEVDLLISQPHLVSLKSETVIMPKEAIKDAYLMRTGDDIPTSNELLSQINKAKESLQVPKI